MIIYDDPPGRVRVYLNRYSCPLHFPPPPPPPPRTPSKYIHERFIVIISFIAIAISITSASPCLRYFLMPFGQLVIGPAGSG